MNETIRNTNFQEGTISAKIWNKNTIYKILKQFISMGGTLLCTRGIYGDRHKS